MRALPLLLSGCLISSPWRDPDAASKDELERATRDLDERLDRELARVDGELERVSASQLEETTQLTLRIAALEAELLTVRGQADDTVDDLAALEARLPQEFLTDAVLPVRDCVHLQQTLEALSLARIASSALVTLQVAPGDHVCPAQVRVSVPDGARVQIVGAGVDVTTLRQTSAISGFLIGRHGLGGLQDLTIATDVRGGAPDVDDYLGIAAGISLRHGGALENLRQVRIDNFAVGLGLHNHATLHGAGDVTLEGGHWGLFLHTGSTAYLQGTTTIRDAATYGVVIRTGSVAWLDDLIVEGNTPLPLYALYNSWLEVRAAELPSGGGQSRYAEARYSSGVYVVDLDPALVTIPASETRNSTNHFEFSQVFR